MKFNVRVNSDPLRRIRTVYRLEEANSAVDNGQIVLIEGVEPEPNRRLALPLQRGNLISW